MKLTRYLTAFLIILAVRLTWVGLYRAYAVHMKHSVASQDETFENGSLARNLLAGKGFYLDGGETLPPGISAEKPPAYPFLLAGFFRLFGDENLLPIRLFQAVLMSVATLLLMRLFSRIFDPATGVVTGMLLCASPALGKADAFIENVALSIFISSFFLFYLWKSLQGDTRAHWKTGLWMGLTALANPSFVPFFPFALVFLFAMERADRWRRTILVAVLALVVIFPWAWRNRVTFGQWIPVNSNFPFNIWMGSNPDATGALALYGGKPLPIPNELIEQTRAMNEVERFNYFGRAGWRYAREHPGRFLRLRTRAYFYFWMTSRPWLGYGERVDWVNVPVAALMLLTALAGLWLALPMRPLACAVFLFLFLAYSSVYGLTHADSIDRYRLPLDPYLLGFSAYWFRRAFPRISEKLKRNSADAFYNIVEA